MALTTVVIWGLTYANILTLASIAYQVVQARKMKKAAREAAEARKGFEVVVDGEAVNLPVIYGRAKVGGVRTYHNVANNFNYVTPNSDKQFITEGFSTNLSGEKNEYLFYQQALCQGPIHRVYDVVFDESRYIDDSEIGKAVTQLVDNGYQQGDDWVSVISDRTDIKAGFRVDLHYGDTPIADSIMTANFAERANSKFTLVKDTTGLAYASVAIKLNRDEPQFNNVPSTQFFIEGKKVFDITRSGTAPDYTYSLASTRTYSNNSALCLLDYLTDTTVGKSLSLSQIDLESFYNAKVIANTIVQSNITTGGKLWQPTDGSRNITSRNLPLYECNIIVDTQKPIRENVESILATMGDARLVWSSGRYKLNVQYPTSNSAVILAAELTDEDLVLDDSVQINWPTASERLNNCTVRFHNESENFKEDTVSWPPKTTGSSLRGVGGFKYPVKGGFSIHSDGGKFLNSYGVWAGDSSTTTLNYKFYVKETGNYTFDYTGDDRITVTITDANTSAIILSTGEQSNWASIKTASVSLTANTIYSIQIIGSDIGVGEKGVAAKLHRNNFIVWTTRSDAYTGFITVNTSSAVYDQMLIEDSDLELETDLFADGITDYYHALAKAEELVRTSRSAFGITFKYVIKDTFLEPGDFISLNSDTLQLGQTDTLYLRVNQVKVTDESTCEVTATRFDYTQLAWNVKDDEYLKPNNAYNFVIDQPRNLTYTAESVNILSSIGRLDWDDNSSSELSSYIVYMYTPGNVNPDGTLIWTELGRSIESQFILPALTLTSAIFGVRAMTKGGKLSEITTTGLLTLIPAVAASPYTMSLSNDSISLTCDKDGAPLTGQLPKSITITINKGTDVITTGVTYSITTTGCTASRTGNVINLTAISSQYASISVTAVVDGLTLNKAISISKSTAGATGVSAITGLLTNESATVAADNLGVVTSFSGTGGTFKVFDGTIDKTGDVAVTYSVNASSGVTISIASTGVYTVSDMSADTGTATLRAVYNSVTIDKVYSIAKSKAGATGTAGNKSVTIYLYQWATTQPSNPNGTSSYDWTNSSHSSYTGGNNWSTTIDTNPGSPLIKLWVATKTISALATATTTTNIDWTTGIGVAAFSQNGSTGPSGLNATQVKLYQPALSIPTGPLGTSTYTWSTSSYSYGGGNGWSTSPPTSTTGLGGQTLWVATVSISDSASNLQTTINWATASITAESYYGTASTTPGPAGASARVAYAITTTSPSSTPASVTVTGDALPTTGSWFTGITWQSNAPASLAEGQFLYQVDGLYNPATGVNSTTWQGIPYLSSLKVGNLAAISTNTGQLTVTDTIKVGSTSSTTNGVLITTNGIEIYNAGVLRVKLGNI